jgi:hypothetical protein
MDSFHDQIVLQRKTYLKKLVITAHLLDFLSSIIYNSIIHSSQKLETTHSPKEE